MPTKPNSAGEQQQYDPNTGKYGGGSSNENKISELESQLQNAKGLFEKAKIRQQLNALKGGFSSVDEYLESEKKKREEYILKEEQDKRKKIFEKENAEKKRKEQLEQDIKEASSLKRKQFNIVQNNNPMTDEYHVGIRSPKDIKTFEETINDEDSFAWGDFSREQAQQALKKGTITVYSSYPIKQGVFVSTSKIQAEQYAGGSGKKIYSQKIPLDKIAWINGDEGQFADASDSFSNFKVPSKEQK